MYPGKSDWAKNTFGTVGAPSIYIVLGLVDLWVLFVFFLVAEQLYNHSCVSVCLCVCLCVCHTFSTKKYLHNSSTNTTEYSRLPFYNGLRHTHKQEMELWS